MLAAMDSCFGIFKYNKNNTQQWKYMQIHNDQYVLIFPTSSSEKIGSQFTPNRIRTHDFLYTSQAC